MSTWQHARQPQQPLRLAAGAVISSRFADSRLLSVRQGRVWITQEGRVEDFWLLAGDSMLVQPACLIVMEADDASEITLEAAPLPTLAQWCRARLQGWYATLPYLLSRRTRALPGRY